MPRVPPPKPVEEDEDEIIEEEEEEEEVEEEPFDLVEAMNNISIEERPTVYGLRGLTAQIRALHKQMKAEAAALELKLATDAAPLFEERRKIVTGEREATAAEIAAGTDAQASTIEEVKDEEEAKKPAAKKARVVTPAEAAAPETGIPDFWLTAMKNHEVLESLITERDIEALAFLRDVRSEYIDGVPEKGFKLTFVFAENPFFTDTELTKQYVMDTEDSEVLDKSVGCDIHWTAPAKNLTIEIKQKKQRSKTGKGVRVVQREEKVPSFFRFFAPMDPEADVPENEEEDSPDLDPDFDYEAGMAFRDGVVPRAVFYYTGEALAQLASGLNFGDDGDEEGEEEEEEEEEEEVPVRGGKKGGPSPAPKGSAGGAGGKPGQQPPECKQQ